MLEDFNQIADDALSGSYDLLIAGTGPAGMTVARKVAAKGGRVLLLEAGGLSPSKESSDVYKGRSAGTINYPGIERCRLRHFGGTSGHWAGRCALLDPIDFEQREIFGMPGWPISWEETYTHLDEAKEILDIADKPLTGDHFDRWSEDMFRIATYAMSAPTRFGSKYREEVESSDRIRCVYNANLTDLQLSEDGRRIVGGTVTGYDGTERRVSADRFVVAMGAMENARFLLNARSQMPNGLGNQNDWVGRTFMEHFMLPLGNFVMTDDSFWADYVNTMGRNRGKPMMPGFDLMREWNISNATIAMSPVREQKFYGRLAPLRRMRHDMSCTLPAVRTYLEDRDSTFACKGQGIGNTGTITEHLPNRDSRVTVDPAATDQFGNPRLVLHYEISDDDIRSTQVMATELGKAYARQDIARLRVPEEILNGTFEVGAHCHHMGTTRMAARAEDGVVDRDCRVHGIDNLYMGGSSVFSTGGGVNPTLTIVALALRLGEHIGSELTAG